MFSCWCKFRKAKSWFNDFWVGVFKNGHDLFSATNNGQWPIITTHFLCFTGYLSPIYWQVYLIQFVDQLYLKQLLNFLYAKRRFLPGKKKEKHCIFFKDNISNTLFWYFYFCFLQSCLKVWIMCQKSVFILTTLKKFFIWPWTCMHNIHWIALQFLKACSVLFLAMLSLMHNKNKYFLRLYLNLHPLLPKTPSWFSTCLLPKSEASASTL